MIDCDNKKKTNAQNDLLPNQIAFTAAHSATLPQVIRYISLCVCVYVRALLSPCIDSRTVSSRRKRTHRTVNLVT
jgi:hypothetical protein